MSVTEAWIKRILDEVAIGKLKLSHKDEAYIGRIAYLACEISSRESYEDDELYKIFERD